MKYFSFLLSVCIVFLVSYFVFNKPFDNCFDSAFYMFFGGIIYDLIYNKSILWGIKNND